MSEPLPLGKKMLHIKNSKVKQAVTLIRNNNILFIALMLTIFGSMLRLLDAQPTFYALAYTGNNAGSVKVDSPLFGDRNQLFQSKEALKIPVFTDLSAALALESELTEQKKADNSSNEPFAQKLYAVVGSTPIREMIPFISKRDQKVAAFLVGIAKKESSLGTASPSKDGKTCYNYWGYKGIAGRGTGMGYACFNDAEEAVAVVGDRIETLVNKNRSTPSKMVDTWKCGVSCAGDPGAQGWVSTVALYFNKIVDQNS